MKIDVRAPWPKYLMQVDDSYEFMNISLAGKWFDSGWNKVDIMPYVLNEDLTVRLITEQEKQKISDLADQNSANK